jgi:hypothetical protein
VSLRDKIVTPVPLGTKYESNLYKATFSLLPDMHGYVKMSPQGALPPADNEEARAVYTAACMKQGILPCSQLELDATGHIGGWREKNVWREYARNNGSPVLRDAIAKTDGHSWRDVSERIILVGHQNIDKLAKIVSQYERRALGNDFELHCGKLWASGLEQCTDENYAVRFDRHEVHLNLNALNDEQINYAFPRWDKLLRDNGYNVLKFPQKVEVPQAERHIATA